MPPIDLVMVWVADSRRVLADPAAYRRSVLDLAARVLARWGGGDPCLILPLNWQKQHGLDRRS